MLTTVLKKVHEWYHIAIEWIKGVIGIAETIDDKYHDKINNL